MKYSPDVQINTTKRYMAARSIRREVTVSIENTTISVAKIKNIT
jgi:hypothetical protein